jgi:hypothetical protein
MAEPTEVFISYCSKDRELREELHEHLKPLERRKVISLWFDQKLSGGDDWKAEIDAHLRIARIVLLLVSRHFINSEQCRREVDEAIKQQKSREVTIIPVIISSCLWEQEEPLSRFQVLPESKAPIASLTDRHAGWREVAAATEAATRQITARIARAQSTRQQRLVEWARRAALGLLGVTAFLFALLGISKVWGYAVDRIDFKAPPPLPTDFSGLGSPRPVRPPGGPAGTPGPGTTVVTKSWGTETIGARCSSGLNTTLNCACEGTVKGRGWSCAGKPVVVVNCVNGIVQAYPCAHGCGTRTDQDDVCM